MVTNAQILIYGNVRDQFLIPSDRGGWLFRDIQESLWWCLSRIGYPVMIQADIMDGLATAAQRAARRGDGQTAARRGPGYRQAQPGNAAAAARAGGAAA